LVQEGAEIKKNKFGEFPHEKVENAKLFSFLEEEMERREEKERRKEKEKKKEEKRGFGGVKARRGRGKKKLKIKMNMESRN